MATQLTYNPTEVSRKKHLKRAREERWRKANLAKVAAATKRRYEADPEKHRAVAEKYRKANLEKVAGRLKRWREANGRHDHAVRRARQEGAPVVERVDRMIVWERDEGFCGICYKPTDPNNFHVDHVISLARGGAHSYDNCQVAHPTCNVRKGAR